MSNSIGNPLKPELIGYEGRATGNGAVDGSTIVDANVNTNDTGKAYIILSGARKGEIGAIVSIIGTTVTLSLTGAQLTTGVSYCILNQQATSTTVATIAANVLTILGKTNLIPADITAALDTVLPAVKAKTDLIPADITAALDTTLPAVKTQTDKLNGMCWQVPQVGVYIGVVSITATPSDIALGNFSFVLPAGRTVAHLFIHFLFSSRLDNSGAINALTAGAQALRVKNNAGAYTNFFNTLGSEYNTPASGYGAGDVKRGAIDVAALAPVNGDVLTFQWHNAAALGSNLNLTEFQLIPEVWVV
jgi:hypothetical protein